MIGEGATGTARKSLLPPTNVKSLDVLVLQDRIQYVLPRSPDHDYQEKKQKKKK